jgi:hypothetical protein
MQSKDMLTTKTAEAQVSFQQIPFCMVMLTECTKVGQEAYQLASHVLGHIGQYIKL